MVELPEIDGAEIEDEQDIEEEQGLTPEEEQDIEQDDATREDVTQKIRLKSFLKSAYPMKSFYFYMVKELGKRHSTSLSYCRCVMDMFNEHPKIEKYIKEFNGLDLAIEVRKYVVEKNRKYPVSALYTYLQFLYEKEKEGRYLSIQKNIMVEVKKLKITTKKDRRYLNREQVKELVYKIGTVQTSFGDELKLFVMMQYETACRSGALHRVTVSNLEFDEQNARYWLNLLEKGGKRIRHPISRSLTVELKEFIIKRGLDTTNPSLFKISYQHLWRELKSIAKEKMGIDFYPHMLRRTTISEIYNKTKDVKLCQKKAGHSDSSTTMRCYIDSYQSPEDIKLDDMEW